MEDDDVENDDDDSTDMDEGVDKNANESNKYSFTVKMRGIPFKCTEKDIIGFFSPIKITDIRIPLNDKNKAKGTAYVDFEDEEGVLEAMKRNKQNIKGRYIELFRMDAHHSFAEDYQQEEVLPWNNKVSIFI